jgi:hypothetical protein
MFTPAPHRDESDSGDPRGEYFPASLDAQQLVREWVYEETDQHSTMGQAET